MSGEFFIPHSEKHCLAKEEMCMGMPGRQAGLEWGMKLKLHPNIGCGARMVLVLVGLMFLYTLR